MIPGQLRSLGQGRDRIGNRLHLGKVTIAMQDTIHSGKQGLKRQRRAITRKRFHDDIVGKQKTAKSDSAPDRLVHDGWRLCCGQARIERGIDHMRTHAEWQL